jgi:Tfp pilus assembly protein PilZ
MDRSKKMQRDAKPIFMVVLSGNREEEQAISDALSAFNVKLAFVPTMRHLRDVLFESLCSGILLSITSLVDIDQTSKSFGQALEHVYPVARIRWDRADSSFFVMASRSGHAETLADFIAICSGFPPRSLRSIERLPKTLNVLISSTPDLANAMRAFTTNIAARGCFLHTPQEWNVGDAVFIQIQELSIQNAIEGRVVRYVPWGSPFRVQGIGIQFVNMDDEQVEALQHLLYFMPIGFPE